MSWSKGHEKCQSCGTTEYKHKARGLCASCYEAAAEKRHTSHITRRIGSFLTIPITKENLEQKYQSGLSLNDIARQFNCTRQYIHKLMGKFKIVSRTMSEARTLALQQGKISYSSEIFSPGTTISHEKRHVRESFFKTWTPAMAWVLGVIYTDGCLSVLTQPRGQSKSAKSGKLRHREQVELAGSGDVTAQFYLAARYEHGIHALKWYILAAEGGDESAAVARDELLKKMRPVQIADARQLAQEWAPQEKRADTVSWRLSIGQKEPELLEKVRALMGSNALIKFSEKRGVAGALNRLVIDNAAVCADLLSLGVTPRKSLTLTFPPMPPRMVRHFVRGCWDGDGSVYLNEKDIRRPGASYISGSKDFIEQLVWHLVDLGLPDRTIHIRNPTTSGMHRFYSIRFSGRDCVQLHHVLYDNVDEQMCLSRKHDRFKAIADYYEREGFEMRPAHRRPAIKGFSQQIARADLSLRGVSTDTTTKQLRAQQKKEANAALKKKTETFNGSNPPPRKVEGNPNAES